MKKLLPWIIAGLLLRLVLMPITLQADFRAYSYAAYLITQKGEQFTFYDHMRQLPRDNELVRVQGDGWFIYPPLAYLSHALFMGILSPVYPWSTFQHVIVDIGSATRSDNLAQLLLLSKLPYLVADGFILWMLYRYLPEKQKRLGSILWICNPITIYSAYMMGQFDIFIAVFVLAAVFLNSSKRPWLAGVALGIAAGFKPFPLVLLPFLPQQKVKGTLAGLITYGLIIAPYITSIGFRQYALFASQSDKLLFAKVLVSGSQYLPLFVVGATILALFNWFRPKLLPGWAWLAAPLMLFYSVTHFHPQWFTWASPLLVLFALHNKSVRLPLLIIVGCFTAIVLSFDSSLNFGLFYQSSLALPGLLPLSDQLTSIVRGVLAGTSFSLFFLSKEDTIS